ncbi:MAG: hypothetical protein HRT94_00510 [Alphaproteobacteria bacterium]|nr:hypothetical protein [Alphaproteobacteria bacterium]
MAVHHSYSENLPEVPSALEELKTAIDEGVKDLQARAKVAYRQFFFPIHYLTEKHQDLLASGLTLHFRQQSGFDVGERTHYEYDQLMGRQAIALGFFGERDDTTIHLQHDGNFTIKSISRGEAKDLTTTGVVAFVVEAVEAAMERQLENDDQYERDFAERFKVAVVPEANDQLERPNVDDSAARKAVLTTAAAVMIFGAS